MNQEHFKQLLESGQYDQAAEVLKQVFETEISEAEKGQALVMLSLAYMKVQTALEKEKTKLLEKTIADINALSKVYGTEKDKLELDSVRMELGGE